MALRARLLLQLPDETRTAPRAGQPPRVHAGGLLRSAVAGRRPPVAPSCSAPRGAPQGRTRRLSARGAAATSSLGPLPSAPGSAPSESLSLTVPPEGATIRKHTVSVFVGDESGMISRIAGVFARRGYNIESLAVGLNKDKGRFTIVVTGSDWVVQQMVKQLYKLVNVREVENITKELRVDRELMLLKLEVKPQERTEIVELVTIFKGEVVDVAENSLTVEVTGDPGKMVAVQRAMSKFTVKQLVRTGKIALVKESNEALKPRSTEMESSSGAYTTGSTNGRGGSSNGSPSVSSEGRTQGSLAVSRSDPTPSSPAAETGEGDVYAVLPDADKWYQPVLDANWAEDTEHDWLDPNTSYVSHTLLLLVNDSPGVLNRITSVFARRGYNVQSLAVGPSERAGESRITMVVPGSSLSISKLLKQLLKLVDVLEVEDLTYKPFVQRELMLIKVAASGGGARAEILDLCSIFEAQVVDVSLKTITLQLTGTLYKLASLQGMLEPYGILEVARTGRVALSRDSGVNSNFLARMPSEFSVI